MGRLDLVENRYVGMKARGCYETPGGTILLKAHRAMESLTLDREVAHLKDELMPRYASLIYNGYWWSPERLAVQALIDHTQKNVNGWVKLNLYKGNVILVARDSEESLFDSEIATFEEDGGVFDHQDAAGFIKLNALRLRLNKNRKQEFKMPSFDITSKANMENIKNAVDVSMKMIINRYDFKGTSAKVSLNETEMKIEINADSEFQIDQIKDILFPALEKKEPDSSKRLHSENIETISGNKLKQQLTIKNGIAIELSKEIIKTIKDSKIKVQCSIQGDEMRVKGPKRDVLQECIALVKKQHNEFPLKFGNFRD